MTAQNAFSVTTQNYDGSANTTPNFAKTVTLAAWDGLGSTTTQNPPSGTGAALSSATIAAGAFTQGVTSAPATPTYSFGAAQSAPTNVYLRASDATGVSSLRVPSSNSVEGGVMVVCGRAVINGAYGSEFAVLSVPLEAQYYTGSYWTLSATDSQSSIPTADVAFSTWQSTGGSWTNGSTAVSGSSPVSFANGLGSFTLTSPGQGNTGNVYVTANGAGTYPTNTYSCAGLPANGNYLPSNWAEITFGVYKGSSRSIYVREN